MPNEYPLSFMRHSAAYNAAFDNIASNHALEIDHNPRYREFLINKRKLELQKLSSEMSNAADAYSRLSDNSLKIAPSKESGDFGNHFLDPLATPKQLLSDWRTGMRGSSFMQQLSDYSNAEKAALLLQPFAAIGLPAAGLYGGYLGIDKARRIRASHDI